ncbi:MAG: thioredoxin family protein [Bacteroidia bacterium]|nr:thioredoxin family protein [Bacteroidia bacterium]
MIAILLGPDFINWLSTHWIPNLLFFLLFVLFAASFFGLFEIVLPSSLVNKSDQQADKGGLIGTFFMALTLVLVSFSCTAPIIGGLLVEAARGSILRPVIGMFGFSLAFAIPFTLLAFFPSWLNKLPKSGGWMNSVKVVLGFVILALGMKFLIIPDQIYHWNLLDREVYIAFWIVIFTLMGLYLLGKLKFSHDSDVKHIGVARLVMAILTFTFVVYLIPGMFGAPLKAISSILPPIETHDFNIMAINKETSGYNSPDKKSITLCETPKFSEFLHIPYNLEGFFDFKQGIKCAKRLNKPVFLDFTGHGCAKCKDMEANVWSDSRVLKMLRENYIIITLYTDDRTTLPEEEWILPDAQNGLKRPINDMGRKNTFFQQNEFGLIGAPYYALLDCNGNVPVKQRLLVTPHGYNLNIEEFIKFLDKGIEQFKRRHS